MYDVAVLLTSDSQHGPVGRIELQDAQGLVLRPFLEAAVQLELHDPCSPSRPIASLTPYSGPAPHACLSLSLSAAFRTAPRLAMAMSFTHRYHHDAASTTTRGRLSTSLFTSLRDAIPNTMRRERVHPPHVRFDARASTAKKNVTLSHRRPLLLAFSPSRVFAPARIAFVCLFHPKRIARLLRTARRNMRLGRKNGTTEPR